MIAVITGDIVKSSGKNTGIWQEALKTILKRYGKSPHDWEIFRGDSFQIKLLPSDALIAAIHIKSAIKHAAGAEVRMGIGVGREDHKGLTVTESTGSAYTRSGHCFDSLKKQTLAIETDNSDFDEYFNLLLSFALVIIDNWTKLVAGIIQAAIQYPDKSQKELAAMMNKSQSSISEALNRGAADEIKKMLEFYEKKINSL